MNWSAKTPSSKQLFVLVMLWQERSWQKRSMTSDSTWNGESPEPNGRLVEREIPDPGDQLGSPSCGRLYFFSHCFCPFRTLWGWPQPLLEESHCWVISGCDMWVIWTSVTPPTKSSDIGRSMQWRMPQKLLIWLWSVWAFHLITVFSPRFTKYIFLLYFRISLFPRCQSQPDGKSKSRNITTRYFVQFRRQYFPIMISNYLTTHREPIFTLPLPSNICRVGFSERKTQDIGSGTRLAGELSPMLMSPPKSQWHQQKTWKNTN